jgi:hypothetical protein
MLAGESRCRDSFAAVFDLRLRVVRVGYGYGYENEKDGEQIGEKDGFPVEENCDEA